MLKGLKKVTFSLIKLCVMQDGYLDAVEVANWILPGEVDHAENEAKHLIHETDTDKVDWSCSTFLSRMCSPHIIEVFKLIFTSHLADNTKPK